MHVQLFCFLFDCGVFFIWVWIGFSDPRFKILYVLGDDGRIVAILFGGLWALLKKNEGNKILWVVKDPLKLLLDLCITVRLVGTCTIVYCIVVGGFGSLGIDLLRVGCWCMMLKWSGWIDYLSLCYCRLF